MKITMKHGEYNIQYIGTCTLDINGRRGIACNGLIAQSLCILLNTTSAFLCFTQKYYSWGLQELSIGYLRCKNGSKTPASKLKESFNYMIHFAYIHKQEK